MIHHELRRLKTDSVSLFVMQLVKDMPHYIYIYIYIVDLPIENGGSFHSYVSLPEGKWGMIFQFIPIKYNMPENMSVVETFTYQNNR